MLRVAPATARTKSVNTMGCPSNKAKPKMAITIPKVGTMNMNLSSPVMPKLGVMPNVVPAPRPMKLRPVIW